MPLLQRLRNTFVSERPAQGSIPNSSIGSKTALATAENKLPQLRPNVLRPSNVTNRSTPSRQENMLRPGQQSPSPTSTPSNGNINHEASHVTAETKKVSNLFCDMWKLLLIMSAVSILVQLVRIAAAIPWAVLTYRAGFVGASLSSRLALETIGMVIPLVCEAGLLTRLSRTPPSSRRRNQGYIGATALVVAVMVVGEGINRAFSLGVPTSITRQLSLQGEAVTRFNQGFCHAWCRQNLTESSMAAFARGECGPDETTAFDYFVSLYDIKDWCEQAFASQNYSLGSQNSGISPFASWNDVAVAVETQKAPLRTLIIMNLYGSFLIQVLMLDMVMEVTKG